MIKKGKAASISQRLSNLAQKDDVSYQNIATSFLIERLVARLTANQKLAKQLVFKGGYVGLRIYQSLRYTVDLDALLQKADLKTVLGQAREAAEKDLGDAVWFQFEKEVDHIGGDEYGGVRQVYRAGIGEIPKNLKKVQVINFDVGVGDAVVPGPVQTKTPSMMGDDEIGWLVYPIETVVAEKLHAFVSRGADNSRSKDIYDLAIFLPKVNPKVLAKALKECFAARDLELPENLSTHLRKIDPTMLRRGWPSAVSGTKNAPNFDEAYEGMLTQLKKILDE